MKLTFSLPTKKAKVKKHGFALIATMILMMLLTIIGVGLMALAASQSRIASNAALVAEARQMALVGLDAALGEMQVELGIDTRITANSSILQSGEQSGTQFLLGVWESYDGPIYGKSKSSKVSNIQATYDKGRESMFRRWMVSANDTKEARKLSNADSLVSRKPGRRVCLMGEGTLGNRHNPTSFIYADLICMPSRGQQTAHFAWWVGGENQKAKLNIIDPKESSNPLDILTRTWNTPGPMFVDADSQILNALESELERPERLLTMGTLPLAANSSQEAGMPYFFDATLSSFSLPVNLRYGGLKQDLNLLLNKETLKNTEFKRRSNSDCPLVEQGGDVPSCSESEMPIGSWQVLHAYYNTWPDGTGNSTNGFSARLLGSVNNAYTRMSVSGYLTPSAIVDNPLSIGVTSSNSSNLDTKTMLEDGGQYAGYARIPVMLAYMSNFGLVTERTTDAEKVEDQRYKLGLCFAPMFLWWNPYNVPMKVKGKMLWSHSIPYKTSWIETWSNTIGYDGVSNNYRWSRYAMGQQSGVGGLGNDYGEFFTTDGNSDADIEFAPGEILFFSPSTARSTDDYNKMNENPWENSYNPSNVSGYKAHFYSNKSGKEVAEGAWYVRLRLGIGEQPSGPMDGYWFAPGRAECITVMNGVGGIAGSDHGAGGNGKRLHSPHRLLLGWYDPALPPGEMIFCDESRNDATWTTSGQDDPHLPYYVTSIGVTAKSANRNLDSRIFPDKDFRTKIWQHSSPAFFGSMLVNPSDQDRQYNPYQLSIIEVSTGLSSAPMENTGRGGRNGLLGITSDGEQVSFAATMELPVHPPFSLAGFAGMRLQPGWYNTGSDTKANFRRIQYQAGVPSVGIGNSFADPCLPADSIYTFNINQTPTLSNCGKIFSEFYDHGLLINDALWDRFFCSSISDRPNGSGKTQARQVLNNFLNGEEPLPVSRYKKTHSPYSNKAIIERIMEEDGWKHIAQFLVIDGGFNVNSTSIEAWTAVLQGLAKRQLVSNANSSSLSLVEQSKKKDDVIFSRFAVSTTAKSLDSEGGYSPMQGSSSLRSNSGGATAWGEVRLLDSMAIRQLAEKMVEQVRKRGPFLNMSDFINRRLESGNQELSLKGALQAAIDETDINRDFEGEQTSPSSGNLFKFAKAEEGSIHTAAPGYLIQSDVLSSLGNILTLRDDTFTVRSYGCVKSATGSILAQAWCEATVQRCIEYVDPSNAPYEAEYKPDGSKGDQLSDVNRILGRKLRVISFKWLDAWDI